MSRMRAGPFAANHPEFPDSWLRIELALFKQVSQVFVDRSDILLEELGHKGLAEPHRLIA